MPAPRQQFGLGNAAPRWWLVLAVLITLFVRIYSRDEEHALAPLRLTGETMGTTYSVVLGKEERPNASQALHAAVRTELAGVNASMSTYDAGSELSRFNRHDSSEPVEVSAALAQVLAIALDVSRQSDGAFDVTFGPLFEAWGFGPVPTPARAVSEPELRLLREHAGYDKLSLVGRKLSKAHPALRVDLSAIAKGYGVDEVAALLEARGHRNYLVEIGGEVRVRGQRTPGQPFRVAIEAPVAARGAVHTALALSEGAVATSGNYRNQVEVQGQRYAHTIDPRTGRPVHHALLSASVLHERCALADAWATALMVVGPEQAWQLARAARLEVLLLVAGENGRIIERATPGFEARRVADRRATARRDP